MTEPTVTRLTAAAALGAEAACIERGAEEPLAALCLSGGGIRSAAFSLGVLQGLAQRGLLGRFHYLSTVSGGGYVGGWLTASIGTRGADGVREVEAGLKATGEAPPRLRDLRRAGNFLTPQLGLFSTDTWAVVTLYVRNLLLTWLAFLPPLLCLVLLVVFYRYGLAFTGRHAWLAAVLLLIGCAGLGVSTFKACRHLPSHAGDPACWAPADKVAATARLSLLWPALAPAAMAVWFDGEPPALAGSNAAAAALLAGAYALTVITAYFAVMIAVGRERARLGADQAPQSVEQRDRLAGSMQLLWRNVWPWLLATAIAAGLTALGVVVIDVIAPGPQQPAVLAVLAPVWFTIAIVFHTGAHIGFRREARFAELDREWTARFTALILRAGVVGGFVTFCVLGLSDALLYSKAGIGSSFWPTALSPLVSGPIAAWLGQKAFSRLAGVLNIDPDWRDTVVGAALGVLALAFVAGLLAAVAYVLQTWWMDWAEQLSMGLLCNPRPNACTLVKYMADGRAVWDVPIWVTLVLLITALLLAAWVTMTMTVDNNRFSLHGLYRNRLVRAFLGAARAPRQPDGFTGFDPGDDPRLATLSPAPRRLFPVLNIAVNLTSNRDPLINPTWAERKALSFTATPLHCGFLLPGREFRDEATYVATRAYAGLNSKGVPEGLALGAAMTISGAAASPNSGYHSSTAMAFLMTLFNVRLGVWLPNPYAKAAVENLAQITPQAQRRAMFGDLLGLTSVTGQALYLSDGGHFDNLGLYEMLRRRCTLILMVDAAQDASCAFSDLGNAVRKAAIDLAVRVQLDTSRIAARQPPPAAGRPAAPGLAPLGFAIGSIIYPAEGGHPACEGKVVYIKPSWLPVMPVDVRAHGATSSKFPHDSTGDQWFSESQFESYRRLGEYQFNEMVGAAGAECLTTLFATAATRHKA